MALFDVQIEFELEVLVFVEGGKPEDPKKTGGPGEKPSEQGENQQQTQPTRDQPVRDSNPGHSGGRRAYWIALGGYMV